MEALAPVIFIVLLAVNGLISWLNCRSAGMAWKDTMAVGSWFEKALLWSAAVQSTVGFSMLILVPGAFGLTAYLSAGTHPTLTPDEAHEMLQGVFSFWWLAVIFPVVGSGTIIWVHSIRVAIQTRRPGAIAAAAWNTFAQVMNTISLFRDMGEAITHTGKLFKSAGGGDNKGKVAIAFIILGVVAIVAGGLITAGLIAYYARTSRSVVEEKLKGSAA